jgi:hypothetical protein
MRIRKAAGSRVRDVERIYQKNSRANFSVGCAERSAVVDTATHSVVSGADPWGGQFEMESITLGIVIMLAVLPFNAMGDAIRN